MVLEKDESGAQVGKFYSNGKEIKWSNMVETKKVFEKERVDEENNDEDVVIEKEVILEKVETSVVEPVAEGKSVETSKVEPVAEGKSKSSAVAASPVAKVPPVSKSETILPKLIRLVPCPPLDIEEVAVFVVHVESVTRVWVTRECDEVRISLLMDQLARM